MVDTCGKGVFVSDCILGFRCWKIIEEIRWQAFPIVSAHLSVNSLLLAGCRSGLLAWKMSLSRCCSWISLSFTAATTISCETEERGRVLARSQDDESPIAPWNEYKKTVNCAIFSQSISCIRSWADAFYFQLNSAGADAAPHLWYLTCDWLQYRWHSSWFSLSYVPAMEDRKSSRSLVFYWMRWCEIAHITVSETWNDRCGYLGSANHMSL